MSRPRFIAGAVCPECRAVDRIVVEGSGEARQRRCVSCGYTDSALPGAAAPATRFSRPGRAAGGGDSPPTVVRIVEPDKR